MRYLTPALFWLLAVIHILPALSALSKSCLAGLYGISADNLNLMTLLQHRAVLFAIIAAGCVYAAHVASVRWPVLIATTISMASFILIAVSRGQLSGPLAKIAYVDGIGLFIAIILAVILIRT